MALKGQCVAKDEMPQRRANDVVFKMASALDVQSELWPDLSHSP